MSKRSPNLRIHPSEGECNQPVVMEGLEDRRLMSVTLTAGSLTGVEGKSVKGVVATFVTSDPAPHRQSYSALINWDDGQTTVGKVVADKAVAGQFDVVGRHRYIRAKHFHPTVSVLDAVDSTNAQIDGDARIADAPLTGSRKTVRARAGVLFTRKVANFHDGNRFSQAGNFDVTIDWGDGSAPEAGTIVPNGQGSFRVLDTHAYAAAGVFNITVTIEDHDDSSVTVVSTAKVRA
jgi:hypothetical protein